jgi:hypothetical protein
MGSFRKKHYRSYRSKNTRKSNIKRWSKNARKSRSKRHIIKRLGKKLVLAGMKDAVFTKKQMVETVNKAVINVMDKMLRAARAADEAADKAVDGLNRKERAEKAYASREWVEGEEERAVKVKVKAMAADAVLTAVQETVKTAAASEAQAAERKAETMFTGAIVVEMVNTAVNRAVEAVANAAEAKARIAVSQADVALAAATVVRTAGVKAAEMLAAAAEAEEDPYSAG